MKSCITISLVEEARGGPFVLWDGLEESIAFAAELGYDAVEIFAPGPEAIDADALVTPAARVTSGPTGSAHTLAQRVARWDT